MWTEESILNICERLKEAECMVSKYSRKELVEMHQVLYDGATPKSSRRKLYIADRIFKYYTAYKFSLICNEWVSMLIH